LSTPLHPQIAEMLDAAALFEASTPDEFRAMRDDYVQTAIRLGGAIEPVESVEDVVIGRPDGGPGVPARAYRPRALEPVGALLWLHGGGWCIGDLEGFDRVCRSLCNAAAAVVVSVDYRLAPEHRYPAAVEDTDLAVAWATGHGAEQLGFDAGRVAVGGDSAGGNLAAVAALHARDALRAQLLVYPALDPRMESASYEEFGELPLLTRDAMAFCWRTYLGEDDADAAAEPDAAPLRASDLTGAPPAYVAVAGHDVLRDDGVAYARALEDAGVAVTLREYDDMSHGFLRWGGVVERARELIAELGAHARAALRT
jgi:acetyl esterase